MNALLKSHAAARRITHRTRGQTHGPITRLVSPSDLGEPVSAGELVIFDESGTELEIHAKSAARFVLGSAVKHPHQLVTGRYSVHTSAAALRAGKQEIQRSGSQLAAAGIIS
jgi:hypothetical protein